MLWGDNEYKNNFDGPVLLYQRMYRKKMTDSRFEIHNQRWENFFANQVRHLIYCNPRTNNLKTRKVWFCGLQNYNIRLIQKSRISYLKIRTFSRESRRLRIRMRGFEKIIMIWNILNFQRTLIFLVNKSKLSFSIWRS